MGKQGEQIMKKYLLPVLIILLFIFPADAFAGSKTKAQVLSYLTSLPSQSNKKVLSGQFIGWCGGVDAGLFDRIHALAGKYPGIMSGNYAPFNGCNASSFTSTINNHLIAHWNAGGLVEVAWHAFNPVTNSWDHETRVNLVDLVTDGTSTNTNWKAMMDVTYTALKNLQDNGVIVLFRPLLEMNAPQFWWGQQNPDEFKAAWIYTYNYLTTTKGLTNLIWVYSVNNYWRDETLYYPGSSYVDITGFDYYPDDGTFPYVPEYGTLSAAGKPFAFTELGQCSGSATSCSSKDALNIINGIRNNMPNTIYWSTWNDFWGLDKHYNLSALLSDPWVINRDDNPSGAAASDQNKKPSHPTRISIQ